MKKFKEEFWKETSRLIDAHRKDNDERAAQGVVDCRILFTRLVKNLDIQLVSKQRELLIAFCSQAEINVKNDCIEDDVDEWLSKSNL